MEHGVFVGDFAGGVEVVEGLVKGLHALLTGFAHQRLELVHFALADMVLDQRRAQQHFDGRAAAFAIRGGNQLLGDDAFQVQGQVHPQLAVSVSWEEVDDPVQRLVGVVGVQGRQTQVPGFSKGDGLVHGVGGTNLADQNHVRRLTQGIFQGHVEGLGINAHLTLGDDAALVLVDKFDGVFDGDDVTLGVLVAVANHGRQRGGLTGTRSAHENHQATFGHGQFLDHRRQAQVVHVGNLGFNATQHHAHQVALVERGDPETAHAPGGNGKVALVVGDEFLALLLGHHAEHDVPGHVRGQRALGHRQDLAVDFHARGDAGGDKQVRPAFLYH